MVVLSLVAYDIRRYPKYLSQIVHELGAGGQRRAARAFGWGRMIMRKGTHALESGFPCLDAFSAQGRKRVAAHLPHPLPDLRAMVDRPRQADPLCRIHRLFPRLSAVEVRRQLLAHQGPGDHERPTVQTRTTSGAGTSRLLSPVP